MTVSYHARWLGATRRPHWPNSSGAADRFAPNPGTLLARVLQTRQLAHTADYAAEPKPGNAAKLGGARSTLVVPMLKDDELVGAIITIAKRCGPLPTSRSS